VDIERYSLNGNISMSPGKTHVHENVLFRPNIHRQFESNNGKHVFLRHILGRPKYILLKTIIIGNIEGIRSQTAFIDSKHEQLVRYSKCCHVYSDVQKRTGFALRDQHIYAYTLYWIYGAIKRRRRKNYYNLSLTWHIIIHIAIICERVLKNICPVAYPLRS